MQRSELRQFTPKIVTIFKDEKYTLADFRADAIAGITVAIVALPLAMAIAIASGASPDKGLVTAVVAGFMISLLGGSRVQIGGPTGAFVVVVFSVIAQHGYDGLILSTFIAGIILIIAGYARLGQIIKFIPDPVVTGFTTGIAVIIASSQVKDFFGLRVEDVPADFFPKWQVYFGAIDTTQLAALLIGLVSLILILVLRKFAPKVPGYLVAVIFSSVLVSVMHIPVETIGSRFPDIPNGLPMPELPDFSFEKIKEVLPSAFTIAFLAGIEALLSAVVADGMTGYRHRSNQELVGQGVANVVSSCFMGMPATGAIARTATNVRTGGRSPVAGILHAIVLLIFMIFASDVMKFVPLATLAAILFVVAYGMSELHRFAQIFKISMSDRIVLLLTFGLTVMVDLTMAIGVGVTLASLLFMAQMSKTVEFSSSPQDEGEDQRQVLPAGVEVFSISGPVFFGVASELIDTLKRMGQMPKVLIVRMRFVPFLDASGVAALRDIVGQCQKAGTRVVFSGLQPQPAGILSRAHLDAQGVDFAKDYDEALNIAQTAVN